MCVQPFRIGGMFDIIDSSFVSINRVGDHGQATATAASNGDDDNNNSNSDPPCYLGGCWKIELVEEEEIYYGILPLIIA